MTASARRSTHRPTPVASVVIPAHNEQTSIGRLLSALLGGTTPGEIDIVVVCNGCTDGTANIARAYGPTVTVLETPTAAKHEALRLGDSVAEHFPRLYIDADVETTAEDVRILASAIRRRGLLAAAPRRLLQTARAAPFVRWYYDVWQQLPQVRDGLFGRGVIAVSPEGHTRVRGLPLVMSDDLAISEAFSPSEREVVTDATVCIRVPRRTSDLVRRRVRVVTGNAQLDHEELRANTSKTGFRTLASLLRKQPALTFKMPIFLGITIVARILATSRIHAHDYTTWLRDESSRQVS